MQKSRLVACSAVVMALLLGACGSSGGSDATSTTKPGGSGGNVVNNVEDVKDATIRIVSSGSYVEPDETFAASTQLEGDWSGSGFIISDDGLAVTNNHVVTGAASLEVFVGGSDESVNAKVLGVSECSDLAVIDLEGDGYKSLAWYDGETDPGLEVRAAGFPLGDEEYTLTQGIVSKAEADGDTNWASIDSVIEHDAAIQPGNSGGPLVDAETGHVVGVNYAGGDPGTGTSQFFAISAKEAQPLIDDLTKGDVLSLGVNGQAVVNDDGVAGVWVSSVDTNSPAGEAGLQGGDVIEKVEGLSLGTDGLMKDYCDVLQSHDPTDKLAVSVLRFGENQRLVGEFNGDQLTDAGAIFEEEVQENTGSLAAGTSYSDYAPITDDSGRLTVTVPVEWADVDGTAGGDSGEYPQVMASTDLAAFSAGDAVPGVLFTVGEGGLDNDELLDTTFEGTTCTDVGREEYSDVAYTGLVQYYDCPNGSSLVGIAAQDSGQTFTVLVLVQLVTDADVEALSQIFESFYFEP